MFGFCDINGGDMCKSKLGEREIISSYICMRGHVDTWGGEEEGGKGSLPTGDAGMGRKSRRAGSLRQDESEQLP